MRELRLFRNARYIFTETHIWICCGSIVHHCSLSDKRFRADTITRWWWSRLCTQTLSQGAVHKCITFLQGRVNISAKAQNWKPSPRHPENFTSICAAVQNDGIAILLKKLNNFKNDSDKIGKFYNTLRRGPLTFYTFRRDLGTLFSDLIYLRL